MTEFLSNNQFLTMYVLMPLAIVIARICDVSIGTVRIILVSRGMKLFAPILGFFEVLIWLVAISQIMQNLSNWVNYLAYATGFALGNYFGMMVEERLAMGMVVIRIITQNDADKLIEAIQKNHIGTTSLAARGMKGDVRLIFSIIKRKDQELILDLVRKYNPGAFVSISDVRTVKEGYFPKAAPEKTPFSRLMNTSLKRK
ncbi:MAG: DUF2179 domain-containing protein [Candidatus Marinimicrobia bacterium]|jgi:uncharacterized protein YebE (UPF0316 family)|nr:DUF2179 domain-containing protein [Candidatus Neomarinimicrobiota bacterium]